MLRELDFCSLPSTKKSNYLGREVKFVGGGRGTRMAIDVAYFYPFSSGTLLCGDGFFCPSVISFVSWGSLTI